MDSNNMYHTGSVGESPMHGMPMHSMPIHNQEVYDIDHGLTGSQISHAPSPFAFKVEGRSELTSPWTSAHPSPAPADAQANSWYWTEHSGDSVPVWTPEMMEADKGTSRTMSAPLLGQSPQSSLGHSRQPSYHSAIEPFYSPQPECHGYSHHEMLSYERLMSDISHVPITAHMIPPSPPLSSACRAEFASSPMQVYSVPGSPKSYLTATLNYPPKVNPGRTPTPSQSVLRAFARNVTSSPRQLPQIPAKQTSPLPAPQTALDPAQLAAQQRREADLRAVERKRKRRSRSSERGNYVCQICGMSLARPYNLRNHMKTHDKDRPKEFPCIMDNCTQGFARLKDMQRHVDAVHLKIKDKICSSCGSAFTRVDILRRHVETGCRMRPKSSEIAEKPQPKEAGVVPMLKPRSTSHDSTVCHDLTPCDQHPIKRIVNPLYAAQQYEQKPQQLRPQSYSIVSTSNLSALPSPPRVKVLRLTDRQAPIKREEM